MRRLFFVLGAAALLSVCAACAPEREERARPAGCVGVAPIAGERDGMVWIAAGVTTIGADARHPEEDPPYSADVAGFWLDRHEVTNAQFAEFIAATGYVTEAERQPPEKGGPGSAVFAAEGRPGWAYVAGANWRRPNGPASSIAGLERHPVVHVTFADAQAYAAWAGRSLPSEEQYEHAVRRGGATATAPGAQGRTHWRANTWQGFFPLNNTGADGYLATAPVGCFAPDAQGAYDLLGNVWEWTKTPYYAQRPASAALRAQFPHGENAGDAGVGARVIKGGSYLCADNYCARYTPAARQPQEADLGASHIGFRTVLNAPGP